MGSIKCKSKCHSFIRKNLDKINWDLLSFNHNAIHLLEQNPDKINWGYLSENRNAIHLLEKNRDKINWYWLSANHNIFTYYDTDLQEQFKKLTILSKIQLFTLSTECN